MSLVVSGLAGTTLRTEGAERIVGFVLVESLRTALLLGERSTNGAVVAVPLLSGGSVRNGADFGTSTDPEGSVLVAAGGNRVVGAT